MKKITACIVLSLLMCLAMAFPAFATVTKPAYDADIYDLYYKALALSDGVVPSDYKYKIVIVYETSPYFYVAILHTNTISLNISDKYYFSIYYKEASPSYNVSNGKILTLNNIKTETSQIMITSVGGGAGFHYYVNELSTANFYNINTINPSWDFRLSVAPPPINTTALQALITTAKAKQSTGYSASTWQALQNSITAAESLLSTTGYTQAQVDAEKDTLQAALDNLRLLPDVSELQALINQAQAIQKDTHTPETWQSLQDAITAAQALLSTNDYTQTEIESVLSNLQAAINGLDYLPDTTDLEALVEEADRIEDIGYTEPSWNRFDTARTSAHVLLARTSYTAIEVQTTGTELRAAMNALTLIVVTPPVEPPKIPDADYYNVPEAAKKYLNIKDGITPEHLLPAKDAIFEHLETSKKYGLWVYFISLLPIIGIIIFVNFINSGNDVIALNGGNPRYLNSSSTMYGSDGSDRKRLGR